MPAAKSNFLDKVLGRIGLLDREGLESVVQRLARERSFLETLFNTIEDGVMVVDQAGRVAYLNQAVTRLLGIPESTENLPVQELLPELDWESVRRFDANGGSRVYRQEFEVQYPRPRFLRLYAAPLDGDAAGSAGVALILHDSTETRQQTFEAVESERMQALTLLAASVAHEIGNPLNALHIHLQLMERELQKLESTPGAGMREERRKTAPSTSAPRSASLIKLREYLNVAKGEINRLDYIITQFLQALRPAPARLDLESLNDVVRRTLDLLQPELDNRGIHVRTQLPAALPVAPVDAAQVQQALVNLVKNAMHAMTRQGTLTVRTGEGMDGVWVSVQDTGGGIAQDQIQRIFEPFYTTKKKGSGLGMMIVQRIVRAHGGRIEIESRVGHGTTARLWFPLHERERRLLGAPTEAASP